MLKGYKYRLYPTQEQKEFFAQTFGNVRMVYNLALDMRCVYYVGKGLSFTRFDTQAQLVEWKEMYSYLALSNSQSLQFAVKQVDDAFTNWWKGRTDHPAPKRKRDRQAFHNPQHCSIDWKRKTLAIPKCKDIPIVLHRPFYGEIKDVTVSRDPDGRYYASVLVDTACKGLPRSPVEASTTVGIDTGVHTPLALSDGRNYGAKHFSAASAKRLKHYQRELRLQEKGSKNREKTLLHIAKIHSHIAHQRLDYVHKVTYGLTHDSQVRTICIEDLDIRQWMRDGRLAYNAADAGIGRFYDILEYKCRWYGVNLVKIDRHDKSSQTCSVCSSVNDALKFGQRKWTCSCCGTRHDRDYNAAVNIKNFGLMRTLPADGREVTPVDCPPVDDRRETGLRSSGRMKQEKFRDATDTLAL